MFIEIVFVIIKTENRRKVSRKKKKGLEICRVAQSRKINELEHSGM